MAAFSIVMVSCGGNADPDPTPSEEDTPETVEYEKLGEYTFADKTYDIYSAYYQVNESYYVLMFSPWRPIDKKTTYVMLAVLKDHDNVELEVNSYYKNYDYILRYESPKWLYPESFAPQSGTIKVHRLSEDQFTVNLDVKLNDGTPLKLDYTGVFTEDSSEEE